MRTKSRLEGILDEEVMELSRREGIVGIGLVGSLRGEDLWEGSDIDLVLVAEGWKEPTPAYGCALRSGVIIHKTILTRADLALGEEGARRWVENCEILWDQDGAITRAKNSWSKVHRAQRRPPSPEEVYEAEFAKPTRSLERGDIPSCLIHTRKAGLRLSSGWLNGKGLTTRAGGRRSLDQVLSGLHGLGETEMARCLLNLFQAEVSVDQAGKLLDRMIVLSRTTHGYLEETMLVEYLEPSELGLLHHASTANELTDFLEALYRPLAAHYPRSMVASCQFSSAFLAGTILRAQARRNDVGFEEETLARSLSQADLPRGFMGDFHHLQRFHSTLSAQKHAIGKVRGKLRDLLFR